MADTADGRHPFEAQDIHLDITGEVCPMTFVRTRLALEKLPREASLHVRLRAGEPLKNVPRSARELGYRVSEPEEEAPGSEVWRLSIRHGRPRGGQE